MGRRGAGGDRLRSVPGFSEEVTLTCSSGPLYRLSLCLERSGTPSFTPSVRVSLGPLKLSPPPTCCLSPSRPLSRCRHLDSHLLASPLLILCPTTAHLHPEYNQKNILFSCCVGMSPAGRGLIAERASVFGSPAPGAAERPPSHRKAACVPRVWLCQTPSSRAFCPTAMKRVLCPRFPLSGYSRGSCVASASSPPLGDAREDEGRRGGPAAVRAGVHARGSLRPWPRVQ